MIHNSPTVTPHQHSVALSFKKQRVNERVHVEKEGGGEILLWSSYSASLLQLLWPIIPKSPEWEKKDSQDSRRWQMWTNSICLQVCSEEVIPGLSSPSFFLLKLQIVYALETGILYFDSFYIKLLDNFLPNANSSSRPLIETKGSIC